MIDNWERTRLIEDLDTLYTKLTLTILLRLQFMISQATLFHKPTSRVM